MFYNKYLRVIYNKLNLQNHLKPRTRTCMKKINIRLIIYIAIIFFPGIKNLEKYVWSELFTVCQKNVQLCIKSTEKVRTFKTELHFQITP